MSDKIFKLPEWTRRMPDNAYLNSIEVNESLGFKGSQNAIANIRRILGIEPTTSHGDFGRSIKVRPKKYKLSDLRKLEGKEI